MSRPHARVILAHSHDTATPKARGAMSNYQFPDDDTLVRYLAMLRNVLVDVRFRTYNLDPQSAELLDAVENLPDLLTRWPECNQSWIVSALQNYERRYGVAPERYSGILLLGPPPGWQTRCNRTGQ